MRYQTYLKVIGCCVVTTYFLWSVNQEVHTNYTVLSKEVNRVSERVADQKERQYSNLLLQSKRKDKYAMIPEEFDQLAHQLNKSKIDRVDLWEMSDQYDRELLENTLGRHFQNSIESKDSTLAALYMEMALIDRLKHLNDSLSVKKRHASKTKMIVLNEPKSYVVGRSYPLQFTTINTIDPSQFKSFKITQNGEPIQLSDFPLVFNEAPTKQTITVSYKNKIDEIRTSTLETRKHSFKPINNPPN